MTGSYLHVFWTCSKLHTYCPVVLDSHCVLCCRDPLCASAYDSDDLPTWPSGGPGTNYQPLRLSAPLLSLLLFYARKALILYWKKPMTPSLSYWKELVNKVTLFYKATYLNRGSPNKFDMVWKMWLENP